ncbi:alpha/beta hydrolase [Parvibaculaceae bacterium PLY_AMNH_Bact1]|nr:alpha/beta hydrolase [Parvibaculaceae bacterium PLY_AMNH_Bact1]
MNWILIAVLAVIAFAWVNVWRAERRFGRHGHLVTVDGVDLHYVDVGPGDLATEDKAPIVLIHGASGNLRDFEASILPELAKSHRVLAFDRPGHGWSARPDSPDAHDPSRQAALIHAALKKIGVERPVVLGHSWGGAVATAYALQFATAMSGLLVLAGATHPWKGPVSWYHRVLAKPVLGSIFLWLVVLPFGRLLATAGVQSTFTPDSAPEGYEEALGLSLLFRPAHFRNNSVDTSNLRTHLARQSTKYDEITVPTIIVTGNRDQTVMAKLHSYALHEQISGSELIKLQGVGHMPHHVRPDIVIDALERLASGTVPAAGTHVYPPQSDAQKAAVA